MTVFGKIVEATAGALAAEATNIGLEQAEKGIKKKKGEKDEAAAAPPQAPTPQPQYQPPQYQQYSPPPHQQYQQLSPQYNPEPQPPQQPNYQVPPFVPSYIGYPQPVTSSIAL